MNKWFIALLLVVSGLLAEQKVVLITGTSSGIGSDAVKSFQEKGWKVWAAYRNSLPEDLKKLPNVEFTQFDVTNDQQVNNAVDLILKKDGRIDALVNSAGYGLIGSEESVTLDEAKQVFDVNFFGPLRLIQAVLPTMRKQHSGHIINISSGVGVHALPGMGVYSASKFAIEGLSESLAATVSPWNIKVSIVEPGYVKNNWGKHCVKGTRATNEAFYQKLTQGICDMISTTEGQSCKEVADLLVEIAENPGPDLRYQTSSGTTEWIAEKLVDPSGMKTYKKNLQFIKRKIEKR